MSKKLFLLLSGLLLLSELFAGDFAVRNLRLNRRNGFYKKGEEIVVTGKLLKAGKPAPGYKLRVVARWESVKVVDTREFPCDGKPFKVAYSFDEPGWVYFTFHVIGPDGKVVLNPGAKVIQYRKKELVAEIGAMIAPEELRPAEAIPDDFDEFWRSAVAALDAVPMDPRLEKIDSGRPGIDLYTVKVDCGMPQPVTGYLAVPKGAKAKEFPIYLTFLSGVDGDADRRAALNMAEKGCVAMIATWHGFDVNREPAYYRENCKKLSRWKSAEGGRDAFYYRQMYIRALRAAQYLKTRPEWNGRDFLVGGGSLAGGQAAAVAAFDPDVTIAFIHTTSLCGYNADRVGRKRSLPFHWQKDKDITPAMRAAVPWYDVAHFAARIKCEVYFCTAFCDEVCTPSNVYSAYNNLPAGTKKFMTTNPRTGHYGTTRDVRAQQRINRFFRDYWKARGGFKLEK